MSVGQNLRFALRTLRRNPTFAITAVGTLALGISVNTTIFSVVNAVLLQPLPYRDADRLVLLWTTNSQKNAFELSTDPSVRHGGKTHSPFDDNSFAGRCPELILTIPVKRRRALLASNPIKE